MPPRDAEALAERCFKLDYGFSLNVDGAMLCSVNSKRIHIYRAFNESMPPEDRIPLALLEKSSELIGRNAYKMFVWPIAGEDAKRFARDAGADGRLDFGFSEKDCLDIVGAGVNKGRALEFLLNRLGIDPARAAAFGDYQNDIEMLRLAGYSFAMGNALPDVKKAAKYIAKSNVEDGVAAAIEAHFL